MIDIEELRRLAQEATPGPWKMVPVGDGRQKFAVADSEFLSILTVTDEGDATFGTVYDDADAKFIAAANPATINDLLDRLEATEEERSNFLVEMGKLCAQCDALCLRIEAAEKERDAAELMSLALRTKVAEMERQEPVAWLHETRRDSDVVTDAVKHVWGKVAVGSMAAYSIPLYALHGAQTQGEEK